MILQRLISNDAVVMLGRLALWAAAFVTAFRGQLLLEDQRNLGRAVVHMAVAVVFIVAATWRQRLDGSTETQEAGGLGGLRRRLPPVAVPLALLLAALGLGLAFRLYRLTTEPFGIWYDEAQNGLIVRDILHGDFPPIFIGGFTQLPSFFFYVFAGAAKLMGEGIVSLRSVSTLGGVLALPMIFLLARELFGTRVGVLSVFFLAVMRWHVNFSRFGVTNIWASFLALAAVYFLVRGLRGKGWWNLAASGVFAGLGLYAGFYFTFIPLVMALYWLHAAVFRRVLSLREHVLAMVVVAGVAMAVYSPVGIWGLRHPDEFTSRPATASILEGKSRSEAVQTVLKSTKQHVLMFNSAGDRNGRHNIPGEPMLDTFTGVFLVLGIGMSAARARRPEYFLPLVWLVLVLQGGIWSLDFEAPQAFRTSAVTPAVAMLAALPLGAVWAMASGQSRTPPEDEADSGSGQMWRLWLRRLRSEPLVYASRGLVTLALLFFLAQTAYRNYDTYFNVQLRHPVAWQAYSTDVTLVAEEMKRLGPGYDYWLSTIFVGQPTITFVNPAVKDTHALSFDWVRDLPARSDGPAAFFFDISKEPFYRWLQALYPQGDYRTFTPPGVNNPVLVYEAVIPGDAVQALRGLEATYTPAEGEPISRREAALDLDWTAGAPGPLPLQARWSGFIKLPEYRDYRLTLEAPGPLRLFLDGELLAEGAGRVEVVRRLYRGEHALRVEASIERPGQVRLSWDGSPVLSEAYFAYPEGGHGLLGSFYANDNWEGEPQLLELTPLVGLRYHAELHIPLPFTVRWKGYLEAPVLGDYLFRLEAIDDGWLNIDGQQVLMTPHPNSAAEAVVPLKAGRHTIEVLFRNRGGFPNIYLYWMPPNGGLEIIPPARLSPR